MLKKIIIALLLVVILAGAAIYIYRHAIIGYYAEKIIRENLPGYIKIDGIDFDFTNNKISLKNFRILNPPEFSSQFLFKADSIAFRYGILAKGIPKGLEISSVSLNSADIRIERLQDNRVNASEMGKFTESFPPKEAQKTPATAKVALAPAQAKVQANAVAGRKLSDLIKLPSSFEVKGSKIAFIDSVPYEDPYIITVESINGQVSLSFGDNYSKINNLSFDLRGRLNGREKEIIEWIGSLNPATPRITMSNRFEVSDLNLLTFEPYYDRFSPFIFRKGSFSGTLVFDFNNGSIGSTNEIHLSNLVFSVKPGYENEKIWDTNVPDLLRYFTTPSGEVVFDFKLKGDMSNPKPYLGPISKRAIASMVIDKVASYAIDQVAKTKDGAGSNIDKAKKAIGVLRNLLKKN